MPSQHIMKANITNRLDLGFVLNENTGWSLNRRAKLLSCLHWWKSGAGLPQLPRHQASFGGRSDPKPKHRASQEGGKHGEVREHLCVDPISVRDVPKATWSLQKARFTSWMPTQSPWQADVRSHCTATHRLKCCAPCMVDLIHNPKREIVRAIGSRFPHQLGAASPWCTHFHLNQRDFSSPNLRSFFHKERLGLGRGAACYHYNENNQRRAVINHPVISPIKTNSY